MASASVQAPIRPKNAATNTTHRNLLYVALGLVAVLAFSYQIRFSVEVLTDAFWHRPEAAQPFHLNAFPTTIETVDPEAASAGLRKGDELVGINGQPVQGLNTYFRALSQSHPGDKLDVAVNRNHHPLHMQIRLTRSASDLPFAVNFELAVLLGFTMPWFSILLGFYVAAVRPRDPLAWIVLGLLLSFSQVVNSNLAGWPEWLRIPALVYHTTLFTYWPLFMFVFGYYFPQPPAMERTRPWLKWLLIGPYVLMGIALIPISIGVQEDLRDFGWVSRYVHGKEWLIFAFTAGMIGLGITMLAGKATGATTSDARRRLRLLVSGLIVSLTPVLIAGLVQFARHDSMMAVSPWLFIPALMALLIFPFTLAYVIVVDRALDVRVVVRQGLQYAFARSGLTILRIATFLVVGWTGYLIAQNLTGNTPGLALLALALLGGVVLVNLSVKRLGGWLDRRFFRDAYNAEVVLSDLSEQVRTIRDTRQLVETVCLSIANTMHVARIGVFLPEDGCFRANHAVGFEDNSRIDFAADGGVARHLQQTGEAQRVYFEDENSWLYRTPGLDDEQRSKLAYLGAELLLPLSARSSLLGFILAGPKRSEEPYSYSDVRLLSSVAAQTGLALENAQLTTAIATEMAHRERLAREVEIAREVQERLFPQTRPLVEGLDYNGMCRTALGVGGDYYDFLSLPQGRFGFAVGDVSGKGISAALLMASLQASLRGATSHGAENLSELIGNLNRSVYAASANNRYATFFYAQYEPISRQLQFVNAGHNPPILMRPVGNDWSITLLEAGGTVVGLLPEADYGQSTLMLQPGDYLVSYTDGVSEAMNHADEEWGEERLYETVRACAGAGLDAAATMRRVLSAADTFSAGAPQHDDMTLVVLRVR